MAGIELTTLSRNILFAFTDSRKIILNMNITCIKEQNHVDEQLGCWEEHINKLTTKNKNNIYFPHSNNFSKRSKSFNTKKIFSFVIELQSIMQDYFLIKTGEKK
jgi:hypothetical protein